MTRLSLSKSGSNLVFISSDGGMEMTRRLTDMGLVPGEKIRVLHNTGHGQVTLCVKGSKVAIGHKLAQKIVVREE